MGKIKEYFNNKIKKLYLSYSNIITTNVLAGIVAASMGFYAIDIMNPNYVIERVFGAMTLVVILALLVGKLPKPGNFEQLGHKTFCDIYITGTMTAGLLSIIELLKIYKAI